MPDGKMLAIVKETSSPGVSIKEIPIPQPKEGELLVKTKAVSICGTDIGIYDWNSWAESHINPPIVIGHEIVGEVLEINGDNPRNINIGDLVSSETHIYCGKCFQCEMGNKHICENMELFGIGRDGGFAEYATIPIRTSWKNDSNLPIEVMSSQEPLGNAVHTAQKAEVKGKKVLIVGLGPVGLCAASVCKAYDAEKVYAVDPSEYRRNLGLVMGADEVFEKIPDNLIGRADVVLEMSGNENGVKSAFDSVRGGGRIMIFGIPKNDITLNFGKYYIDKELTVMGIFGRRIWETWEQTSELLKSGKVDLTKLITHRFKLNEFEEAMKVMKSGESGKIVLTP